MSLYVKRLQRYGPSKLAVKNSSRPFGFETTPFATLYIESLLSGRPGFDSRSAQTLMACSFAALWCGRTNSTSFERSKPYLLG